MRHTARRRSKRNVAVAVPLAVHSAAWDLLQWNPLWAALTGDPSGLRLVVYTAALGSPDASKLDLLKVTGVQALA